MGLISLKQILALCNSEEDVRKRVRALIDKFAESGLQSFAVARQVTSEAFMYIWCWDGSIPNLLVAFTICLQEIPDRTKDSLGDPWQFVGLLPLFDPPRPESADTIKRALNLGLNIKMITGKSHSSTSSLNPCMIFLKFFFSFICLRFINFCLNLQGTS